MIGPVGVRGRVGCVVVVVVVVVVVLCCCAEGLLIWRCSALPCTPLHPLQVGSHPRHVSLHLPRSTRRLTFPLLARNPNRLTSAATRSSRRACASTSPAPAAAAAAASPPPSTDPDSPSPPPPPPAAAPKPPAAPSGAAACTSASSFSTLDATCATSCISSSVPRAAAISWRRSSPCCSASSSDLSVSWTASSLAWWRGCDCGGLGWGGVGLVRAVRAWLRLLLLLLLSYPSTVSPLQSISINLNLNTYITPTPPLSPTHLQPHTLISSSGCFMRTTAPSTVARRGASAT